MHGVVVFWIYSTIAAIPPGQLPHPSPVKCSRRNLRGKELGTSCADATTATKSRIEVKIFFISSKCCIIA